MALSLRLEVPYGYYCCLPRCRQPHHCVRTPPGPQVVYSYVLGLAFLGERLSWLGAAGSGLIAVGVVLVNMRPPAAPPPAHAPAPEPNRTAGGRGAAGGAEPGAGGQGLQEAGEGVVVVVGGGGAGGVGTESRGSGRWGSGRWGSGRWGSGRWPLLSTGSQEWGRRLWVLPGSGGRGGGSDSIRERELEPGGTVMDIGRDATGATSLEGLRETGAEGEREPLVGACGQGCSSSSKAWQDGCSSPGATGPGRGALGLVGGEAGAGTRGRQSGGGLNAAPDTGQGLPQPDGAGVADRVS